MSKGTSTLSEIDRKVESKVSSITVFMVLIYFRHFDFPS